MKTGRKILLLVLTGLLIMSVPASSATHKRNRFDRQSDRPQQLEDSNKDYWDTQRRKGELERSRRENMVSQQKEQRRRTHEKYRNIQRRQHDAYRNESQRQKNRFDRNADFFHNLND